MTRRRTRALALSFCCLLLAGPALGQKVDDATRGAARQLSEDGVAAYQNDDFKTATQKLEKGYALLKAPVIGLWSARALVKVGKLVEGYERYVETTRLQWKSGDAIIQEKARSDAQVELEQLRPRIPQLVVQLEGAAAEDVDVSVDGEALATALIGEPRPINPGTHTVEGVRGNQTVSVKVSLTEGQTQTARLKLGASSTATPAAASEASPAATGAGAPAISDQPGTADRPRSSPLRTAGWVTLAAGGVGIGIGAVTGLLAMGKKTDLDDSGACDGDYRCTASQTDTVESYNSLRTISGVSFIAGGVLAAAGVVLVVTSSGKREVALRAAPASVQLTGRF